MAIARVVTFEGVSSERMEELKSRIGEGPPEGLEASELIVLHDPAAEKSLAIVFFETEDSYVRGNEILDAMPTPDTPGRRTSVTKFDVAVRATP
jgi:hypothetical protein